MVYQRNMHLVILVIHMKKLSVPLKILTLTVSWSPFPALDWLYSTSALHEKNIYDKVVQVKRIIKSNLVILVVLF